MLDKTMSTARRLRSWLMGPGFRIAFACFAPARPRPPAPS